MSAADISATPIAVPEGADVLFSGSFVATGHNNSGKGSCEVWDLKKMERTGSSITSLAQANIFALSPDGQHFACVISTEKNPTVAVWSVATGLELRRIEVNPSPIFVDILLFAAPGQLVTAKQTVKGRLFQVWDVTDGKCVREILGPQNFEKDSATVSQDGKLLAVFSDKIALVYDLTSGNQIAQLGVPPQPFSYIGARGMRFSPDASELAGVFYNNRETQILSWSVAEKKLIVEQPIPGDVKLAIRGAFSYKGPAFDWLPDGSAFLLYGHAIVDRASGRLVWIIHSPPDDIYPGPRKLLDNDHVVVVGGAKEARRLEVLKLPWPRIDAALKALNSDGPAHVRPGTAVTLKVEVASVRQGTPEQTKDALVQALTERLQADGLQVADGQPIELALRYSEEAGATLHEVTNQGGGPGGVPIPGPLGGNAVPTGRTIQGTKAVCDVSFAVAGNSIWSNRIELDPHHLIVREDASNAAARSATFGMLKAQLIQQPIPYFVPKDSTVASLPGITQLTRTAPDRTRTTTKPTERGKQ